MGHQQCLREAEGSCPGLELLWADPSEVEARFENSHLVLVLTSVMKFTVLFLFHILHLSFMGSEQQEGVTQRGNQKGTHHLSTGQIQ